MQALPHSLQTFVITDSNPPIDLALSDMKELRILIYDHSVNLISIPQNLRCLCYFEERNWGLTLLRTKFPKVPKKNQLAFLNLWAIGPTYGFLESFERLTNLETLKLEFSSKAHILDIFWRVQTRVLNFDKLYMLQDISLSCFNGKTISGFSSKHCSLRYLKLYRCVSLRSCPSVGDLFALEELSFDFCWKLKELPNLQQLAHLRKLNIRGCKSIVAVPGLGNLVALEEFRVSECERLVALPDMHKLTNLQILDLEQSDSLKEVPGLCELIALQTLNIHHEALQGDLNLRKLNKLVTLLVECWIGPPAFSDVVSLEHLYIQWSGWGIEMMPNLLNLARLQSVHISWCSFKDVSCLGNLISLRRISISWCSSLETLPDVHKLTRLERLEVQFCPNVKVWAGVSRSKSLDTLWVDQSRSGTVMALRTLRLERTGLTEPLDLSLFPELKKLCIMRCRRLEGLISTMPMTALERLEIFHCPELQEVPDLSHCKLLSYCNIWCCEKISLTRDEITKLEAMIPGLQIVFR